MARRIVGADLGTRRTAIAVSDPLRLFARPVRTYTPAEAIDIIRGIADRDARETIVFGWPLDADGNENEATERVARYIERVARSLELINPPVIVERWDERGSSREALDALIRAGAKRKQRGRAGATDRVAAAIILQQYL